MKATFQVKFTINHPGITEKQAMTKRVMIIVNELDGMLDEEETVAIELLNHTLVFSDG